MARYDPATGMATTKRAPRARGHFSTMRIPMVIVHESTRPRPDHPNGHRQVNVTIWMGAGGVWGLAWRQATTLDPVKINIVIVAENFQAPMETNPEITF